MFLTLTYKDECLPVDYSLKKKDPVGFFKRLRADLDYDFGKGQRPIKYYCCGEYGEKREVDKTTGQFKYPDKMHGRPHYHAIIFGLSPYDDDDVKRCVDAWQHRCEDWQFDRSRGPKRAVQPVTPEDIEYVVGYVQKKLSGPLADTTYNGDLPPFAIMSKGLGLEFALSDADRLRQKGYTTINGHRISLPRYYRDKLGIEPDYSNIKYEPMEREAFNYLQKEFKLWCKNRNIEYNPDKMSAHDLNVFSKYYDKWEQMRRDEKADLVYKEFLQRSKLKNGFN